MSQNIISYINSDILVHIRIEQLFDLFQLFVHEQIIYYQERHRGRLVIIKYQIPDDFIMKYGEDECCKTILSNINLNKSKRLIYTNKEEQNKIKFDIRYIGFINSSSPKLFNNLTNIKSDIVLLPVIIPTKNINDYVTIMALKNDISDLSKEQKIKNDEIFSLENIIKTKSNEVSQYELLINERIIHLDSINKILDNIYNDDLFIDEFKLEETKYIFNDPIIYLNIELILNDLLNNYCTIHGITKDLFVIDTNYYQVSQSFKKKEFKLNFPIAIKLIGDEFIIKIYIKFKNNIVYENFIPQDTNHLYHTNEYYIRELNKISTKKVFSIVYLTNYGRFLESDDLCFYNIKSISSKNNDLIKYLNLPTNFKFFDGDRDMYIVDVDCLGVNPHRSGYEQERFDIVYKSRKIDIATTIPQSLTYKLPKLFLDVITSFETCNTQLMQDCCRNYLDISKINKTKEKIMKDNIIKEKDKIINELVINITDMNIIIEKKDEDINSLQEQLDEIKKELSDYKIKYEKIKSMFII